MLRRALLFVSAILVFVLGIGLLALLLNAPSGKEKKAWAKIQLEEKELARTFDVVVIQSGFRRRETGGREIYVPSLLVRTTNLSTAVSRSVALRGQFFRKGRIFCGASGLVPELKPGESCEMWLKCIEPTGFGSVAWGLSLAETTEVVDYRILLESRGVSLLVIKEQLRSKFL